MICQTHRQIKCLSINFPYNPFPDYKGFREGCHFGTGENFFFLTHPDHCKERDSGPLFSGFPSAPLRNEQLKADPSQGSHFFQNITSLGIHYITVTEETDDYFDWEWLSSLPAVQETAFIRHVRLENPMTLKIDGRKAQCVMFC
ncbi:MAG: hypothetical protein B6245_19840 [Desulfobacteraceae bacterium 4572_88]|nr:MAG: hypothetical protein B6245_19840 [Desulfobacteraceae bacterium 4572_88]